MSGSPPRPTGTPSFADSFPDAHYDDWRALAEQALKGGDFEKRLVSKTADGIDLAPVYARLGEDALVTGTAPGSPWRICQRCDHPDPKTAASLALQDLEGGADTLSLVFAGSHTARGYGLNCAKLDDLDDALNGVDLSMIALRLEPSPRGLWNAGLVAALAKRRGHAPESLTIDFGFDPIGSLAATGALAATWKDIAKQLGDAAGSLAAQGFKGPFLNCDVRCIHEAGGSEAEELAAALAAGVTYMRALTDAGIIKADAAQMIGFTVAVDADQFLSQTKLRALRRLWARVLDASGLDAHPAPIHAETPWRSMTQRDAAVNILRGTIATFAAAVGGADSVSVLPYTLAHGLPDASARRVARNTQSILAEESNLWRVADPAAGSGAFGQLTQELCETAWRLFQETERAGGIVEELRSGAMQARISATRSARLRDLATGKSPLTGTSAFPLLDHAPVRVLPVAPPGDRAPQAGAAAFGWPAGEPFTEITAAIASGRAIDEIASPAAKVISAATLPSERLAVAYETLRDRADAAAEASGRRPSVFLANIGPLAANSARTTWIRNLLAAGGLDGITPTPGFTASGDVGKAFGESGLSIACICGANDAYAELGEATLQALRSAGAQKVYLAGRPVDAAANMAGDTADPAVTFDGFIHAGQDALAVLNELHEVLHIKSASPPN